MKIMKAAFALAALSASVSAKAITIDFTGFAAGTALAETPDTPGTPNSFTVGDYKFTFWYGQSTNFFKGDAGQLTLGDDQEQEGRGTALHVTRTDGGAFNLGSVTFGLVDLGAFDVRVTVAPYTAGSSQEYVRSDGQTFTASGPAYRNLTELGFDTYAQDGAVGIRSLELNPYVATGGVPEPTQWALMLGGFGVLGTTMRRRRSVARVTYA